MSQTTIEEPSAAGNETKAKDKGNKRNLGQLRRLVQMLRPHRSRFYGATLALLLGSGIGLSFPQLAQIAIDEGISQGNAERLNQVALFFLALTILQAGLTWIRHFWMSWLGERVVADLRNQVFQRLLSLPPSWFQERRTGELVGRLSSDVTVVEGVVGSELSIALRNTVQLFGGLALLFITNVKLTAAMLLIVPPLSVGVVLFGRAIRKMSRALQDRLAEASAQVDETISSIQTVQSFTREPVESQRYAADVEEAFQQALSLTRWRASFMSTASLGGFIAVGGVLWLGGQAVLRDELAAGDLLAFILYTLMVATSLGSLASLWSNLQRAAGATERLFGIIDTVPEIRDVASPKPLGNGKGEISFQNVSFAYPTRPQDPVLSEISLDIQPGEVVALVGSSGAGKTTITSLLQRFFDVQKGTIRVEGDDIRELRLATLRDAIGVVAQEPVLFSGTIRENIAYGRRDAALEDIVAAAKDAHADGFIADFAQGYDTVVGERGVKLSGGQRQRIAIARAILKDPRILILDEATSNLDAESEHLVQEALGRLMAGRTTIVIAHRLSTVREAHRIIVMDQGKIREQGTHTQLMQLEGFYQKLVQHQLVGPGNDESQSTHSLARTLQT